MSGEPRRSSRVQANQAALAKLKEAFLAEQRQLAAETLTKFSEMPPKEELAVQPKDDTEYKKNLARNTEKWQRFMSKRREQKSSVDAIAELFTIKASDLALLNFGPTHVSLWETNYPGDGVRGIFELGDVDEQCNNTVGRVVIGTTLCWICGMPIWGDTSDLPCGDQNGHSPECEHILPVAQAAVFLQLYDKSNAQSDLFKYEYDWSHKTCNQTKNADVYFKVKETEDKRGVSLDTNGLPTFNETAVLTLLERIYDSTRSDATCEPRPTHVRQKTGFFIDRHSFKDTLQDWIHFKFGEPRSVEKWKESRVKVFKAKYDAILDFIGGTNYRFNPQTYVLALASAVAEIVNRQDENRKPGAGKKSVRRLTLGYQPAPTVITPALAATLTADNAAIAAAQDPTPPPAIMDPPAEFLAEEAEFVGFVAPDGPPPARPASYIPPFPPPYDQLISPNPDDLHFTFDMMVGDEFYQDVPEEEVSAAPSNAAAAPWSENRIDRILAGETDYDSQAEAPMDAYDPYGQTGGRRRRTRRRTSSFLPHRRQRSYHAIRTSSNRRPVVGMADSF